MVGDRWDGFQETTVSYLNQSCIESELELGYDKKVCSIVSKNDPAESYFQA